MKSILCKALGATVLALVLAAPASAVVIFSDDFNRNPSSTVGNGWSELNNDSQDVAIVVRSGTNRAVRLRDEISGTVDAAIYRTISTLGFDAITLSYEWAVLDKDSNNSDFLYVDWRVGTGTWTTSTGTVIGAHTLGGSENAYNSVMNVALAAGAANQANFQLRFWTNVSDEDEGALVDNVVLSGNAIAIETAITVPEPTTLGLLGLGLLSLAGLRRRTR